MRKLRSLRKWQFEFVFFLIILGLSAIEISSGANRTVSQYQADRFITKLEENITLLKEQGVFVARFDDALRDMRSFYEVGNYNEISALYSESIDLMGTRSYLDALIKRLALLIAEGNKRAVNTSQSLYFYNIGQNHFGNGDFNSASENLEESYQILISLLVDESANLMENLAVLSQELEDKNDTDNSSQHIKKIIRDIKRAEASKDFPTIFLLASNLEKINKSVNALSALRNNISTLRASGHSTARLEDVMVELELLFSEEAYDEFLEGYNATVVMIGKIHMLSTEINNTHHRIRKPEFEGISFTETEFYLNLSANEFSVENYEKSEEYLSTALELLKETESEFMFRSVMNKAKLRFNYVEYFKKHWWKLLLAIFFLSASSIVGGYVVKMNLLKKKLAGLRKEQHVITELIEKLQADYFKHKVIDKSSYASDYNDFEARRGKIMEEMPLVEDKLAEMSARVDDLIHYWLRFVTPLRANQQEKHDKDVPRQ